MTNLSKFISDLAKAEAGKSEATVGDIRQILKIVNRELGGNILYKLIDLKMKPYDENERQ